MKVNRFYEGKESFMQLFKPLLLAEIDRIVEQESESQYNKGNANTSHSKGVV
ncbi:hypothetical protein P4S95_13305 [Aneurinibacillus aneurinilyticus]|uniref:hypothetical protein n=1 Tax=Aneurinibacillus aneurinilyticus TaxID=1391 RepID=UPI002E23389A|nr:hypothetical protein [Aneurinibacillus aneurinilyticus]